MRLTIHCTMTTEEIGYLLELLHNECYDGNANGALAEALIARLAAAESQAQTEATQEDAYWTTREYIFRLPSDDETI